MLTDEGALALARAKNKSVEFGEQSQQISGISREARALADDLESQAQFDLQNAKHANDAIGKAHDLAKAAITLQQKVT